MDYNFIPGKSFGKISFSDTEADILYKLGEPKFKESDIYDDENNYDVTTDYEYPDLGLEIKFNYFNHGYSGLTISSRKALINSKNIYDLEKNELLKVFEAIYKQRGIPFNPKVEVHDMVEYNEYNYELDEIGVTLWFLGNKLNDIYLTAPHYEIEKVFS